MFDWIRRLCRRSPKVTETASIVPVTSISLSNSQSISDQKLPVAANGALTAYLPKVEMSWQKGLAIGSYKFHPRYILHNLRWLINFATEHQELIIFAIAARYIVATNADYTQSSVFPEFLDPHSPDAICYHNSQNYHAFAVQVSNRHTIPVAEQVLDQALRRVSEAFGNWKSCLDVSKIFANSLPASLVSNFAVTALNPTHSLLVPIAIYAYQLTDPKMILAIQDAIEKEMSEFVAYWKKIKNQILDTQNNMMKCPQELRTVEQRYAYQQQLLNKTDYQKQEMIRDFQTLRFQVEASNAAQDSANKLVKDYQEKLVRKEKELGRWLANAQNVSIGLGVAGVVLVCMYFNKIAEYNNARRELDAEQKTNRDLRQQLADAMAAPAPLAQVDESIAERDMKDPPANGFVERFEKVEKHFDTLTTKFTDAKGEINLSDLKLRAAKIKKDLEWFKGNFFCGIKRDIVDIPINIEGQTYDYATLRPAIMAYGTHAMVIGIIDKSLKIGNPRAILKPCISLQEAMKFVLQKFEYELTQLEAEFNKANSQVSSAVKIPVAGEGLRHRNPAPDREHDGCTFSAASLIAVRAAARSPVVAAAAPAATVMPISACSESAGISRRMP